jgi:Ser/Thr protein kinase RdoA (MazF antagonist)
VTGSSRPFVDRPVADVEGASLLATRVASELGLEPPTLLRMGMNALFQSGAVVIRIGRPSVPAGVSLELADRLRGHGIPVATPANREVIVDGELTATCWSTVETVNSRTDWRAVGEIVRRVHALDPGELPQGYPLPSPTTFPWWDFDRLLDEVEGDLDDRSRRGLHAAVARNRAWSRIDPERTVVCHGDVHPGNVAMTVDGPVLFDWDLMCTAPRGWDHAMLLTLAERWGGPADAYPQFAAGYGESLAGDAVARRFAELRNVAATLMRVRAGRTDDSARAEAERRLRYWRGDPVAPPWVAQ